MGAIEVISRIAEVPHQLYPATTFTPTRYPYKYAADYMREHWTVLLPHEIAGLYETDELNGSRGVASRVRQLWAEAEGVEDEWLARQLANAYLKHEGIPHPEMPADVVPGAEQLQILTRELISYWRKFGTVPFREAAQQLEDVLAGVPVSDVAHRSTPISGRGRRSRAIGL